MSAGMLKWNLQVCKSKMLKCDPKTSSLGSRCQPGDEIFLGETQIGKRLWSTSCTSGLGRELVMNLSWDDVHMTCWFNLYERSDVAVDLYSLLFQANFKPHLHGQHVFFVHLHHAPRLFISALEKLPKTEKELYRGVSCRFLSWIKRLNPIS